MHSGEASLTFPEDEKPSASMPYPQPPIPVVTRQHSYTTISRLLRVASIGSNRSPGTTSPVGAAQLRATIQRLEDIDAESRQLLQQLFSMLEKDSRLERYLRRRLEDPKVSRIWELVEQVLDNQKGEESLDLEQMLGSQSGSSSPNGDRYDAGRSELSRLHKLATDKGLRISDEDMITGSDTVGMGDDKKHEYYGDGLRNQRFKIRTLDPRGGVDDVQPIDQKG